MPRLSFTALLFVGGLLLNADLRAQTYERSFGLEVAPHLGGRRLTAGTQFTAQQLERQDSTEQGIPGFSVGLLFESRADRIGFTTGVRYLDTGYEVEEYGLNGPTLGSDFRDEVRARYLEVPFELNFHQEITTKDRVGFMLGLAANLHLGTTTKRTSFFDGQDLGTEEIPQSQFITYRPVIMSMNTGISYDRKLNEAWAVKVQPYFRFFLQGNLDPESDELNRNYYQTGARITLRRLF